MFYLCSNPWTFNLWFVSLLHEPCFSCFWLGNDFERLLCFQYASSSLWPPQSSSQIAIPGVTHSSNVDSGAYLSASHSHNAYSPNNASFSNKYASWFCILFAKLMKQKGDENNAAIVFRCRQDSVMLLNLPDIFPSFAFRSVLQLMCYCYRCHRQKHCY